MQAKTKEILRNTKEYIFITIGLFLYCFAWKGFLLPHEIVGAGVTGISAIVYYTTGTPVFITYFSINFFLLIISVVTVGWKFSIRSIYGVLVLTFFLSVVPEVPIGTFVTENDGFLACVLGGICWGVGYGIAFLNHGSTGGTTIIAKIINKYSNITLGRAILYCDVLIIGSSYFIVAGAGIEKVVYGLVTLGVTTYVVDLVVSGVRQSVQFFIFTKKCGEIADRINVEVGRGVTVMNATGWYSKEPITVISVIALKSDSTHIFQIVRDIDPGALISQSEVIGVYGKDFDSIHKAAKKPNTKNIKKKLSNLTNVNQQCK